MKYNVYDADGQYLGSIHGEDADNALSEAKDFGMTTAVKVEERNDESAR